jgi:hypothetical protein
MGKEPPQHEESGAAGWRTPRATLDADLLRAKISTLEQKCAALGILEHYKFRLRSARREGDTEKLKRKISQIEKEIAPLEREYLERQRLLVAANLARFCSTVGHIASLTMNRTRAYEDGFKTVYSWVKHYPWEEGSNEIEFETLEELDAGGEPDWFEYEGIREKPIAGGGD